MDNKQTKEELASIKNMLTKKLGKFRCTYIFHNGNGIVHVYVYPSNENYTTRREFCNRERAK